MLGNPGKRPLPDAKTVEILPGASHVPDPHRPLLTYGGELWQDIWSSGISWISPVTDKELLLMTCEMVDERWNLRIRVMTNNDPTERRGLRSLDAQIERNLSLLGFTPADRSRLGVAEVRAASKLEEVLALRNKQ
jgi:hypothetical protein